MRAACRARETKHKNQDKYRGRFLQVSLSRAHIPAFDQKMITTEQISSSVDQNKPPQSPHDGQSGRHSYVSPKWLAAIDKYYEELRRGGVKGLNIDQNLWSVYSLDDLLQQIQNLTALDPETGSGNWMGSLRRLKHVLLNLNDFVAVIKQALEMDGQVEAVIWGSIRLIFKVGSVP